VKCVFLHKIISVSGYNKRVAGSEIFLFGKTIFSVRQKSLRSFAFVLFAGGCVFRITSASLLEIRFHELFLFSKRRTAFAFLLLDFNIFSSFSFYAGGSLPPAPLRQAEPA
jgi:hypothetical protein